MTISKESRTLCEWLINIAVLAAPLLFAVYAQTLLENGFVSSVVDALPYKLAAHVRENVLGGEILAIVGAAIVFSSRTQRVEDSPAQKRQRFWILFLAVLILEGVLFAFSLPA